MDGPREGNGTRPGTVPGRGMELTPGLSQGKERSTSQDCPQEGRGAHPGTVPRRTEELNRGLSQGREKSSSRDCPKEGKAAHPGTVSGKGEELILPMGAGMAVSITRGISPSAGANFINLCRAGGVRCCGRASSDMELLWG